MPTKVSFKFHFMPPPLNRALGGKSIGRLEWINDHAEPLFNQVCFEINNRASWWFGFHHKGWGGGAYGVGAATLDFLPEHEWDFVPDRHLVTSKFAG